MKCLIITLAVLSSVSSFAQRAKKMELVNFVKEAVTYTKEVGFDKACSEFNDGQKFKRGEYYIFAYDFNGVVLCHGGKKALIGKDLLNFKDVKGTELIKDFIREVKAGNGFVKYYWEHPESNSVKKKLGYAEAVSDKAWIGSGIYFDEKDE